MSTVVGKTLFSTIRCDNNAGQQTVAVTDGIFVTTTGPNIGGALLTIQELSVTEYEANNKQQSLTNCLKTRWTPFEDSNILYEILN